MNNIQINGKKLTLSDDGYLLNPEEWSDEVAIALAERDGIHITEDHWKIIRLLRNFYQQFNISPIRKLFKKTITKELGEAFATDQHLHSLFPGAISGQALRIAGLPPAYLDVELDSELAVTPTLPKKIIPKEKEVHPASISYNGKDHPLCKDGNLLHGNEWTKEFAEALAKREGINLTDHHWEIINFLRNFYFEYGVTPMVRLLMKHLAESLGKEKASEKYLYELFPKGPARQGSRIAGLPAPQGCID